MSLKLELTWTTAHDEVTARLIKEVTLLIDVGFITCQSFLTWEKLNSLCHYQPTDFFFQCRCYSECILLVVL